MPLHLQSQVSGQLHVPAALRSGRKSPSYTSDRRVGGQQSQSGRCGGKTPASSSGRCTERGTQQQTLRRRNNTRLTKTRLYACTHKQRFTMRSPIASNNVTATHARRFNSRGYRTYWQEYQVNSIISFAVLYTARRTKPTVKSNCCGPQVPSCY
jgi:hypothetical protein